MYKRILQATLFTLLFIGTMFVAVPATTTALPALPATFAAVDEVDCKGGTHPKDYNGDVDKLSCCPASAGSNPTSRDCFFAKYVNPIVNLLSAAAGIVVLASIIWGAIQYSSAGGESGKVSAAKERIINSLGALAGFVFLYAFLQWVIPGGII